MKDIIIKLFNMEPSDIEQFEVIPCGSVIQCNITLQHRPTPCPSCGKISRRVHDYYRRTLKHAVLVENDLIVVYRKRRYYCTACQKPFPENNPFSLPGKRISQATVIRIMKLLKRESITFSTAAELTDVSTTTVMKVFDEHAGIATVPLPRCLCIDEVYVSKYLQTEYACVLLDFDTGAIYDLIPSRRKEELSSYFSNINKGTRNYVKYISFDMWENYRDLAHRYFPNALVCVDSFHVVKNVNYAFDRVRIRIMNSYDRASEEYRLLKRFHWLLKKSRDNIDFERMINLHRYYYIVGSKYISPEALINRLLEIDPELEIAYTLKCDYDEINSIATYHNAGRYIVTGKPPVPLQTKNKRKRGTSCENSSFFVFRISTRPTSLLARLFHLGNPLFAFFRKLLRPWKQVLQEIQIRIIHVFRNLGQQMRDVVEDIQIVEFAGLHNAVDDGTGFGSVDGVD